MGNGLYLLVTYVFFALMLLLQIKLSKRDNKWPGLVLPMLNFLCSLLIVFALYNFQYTTTTEQFVQMTTEEGGVISSQESAPETPAAQPELGEGLATVLPMFLILNFATVLFLVIYFVCRESKKRSANWTK